MAPNRPVIRVLGACEDAQQALWTTSGATIDEVLFPVTDPAHPEVQRVYTSAIRTDPKTTHPGGIFCGPYDEIRIILTWDAAAGVLRRTFGMRNITPGAAGDAELAQIIGEQSESFDRMGKHVPVTIAGDPTLAWQHVVDVMTLCHDRHVTSIDVPGGNPFRPPGPPPPLVYDSEPDPKPAPKGR